MKWRKVCPASRSLSLQANIPCIPRASMDSIDGFFPSRKPPGSGEFRGLVHDDGVQRPGFSFSHFCGKGSPQPAGLLRAVSFFLQIHKGKPRAQAAFENGGRWACPVLGWGPACPGRCLTALLLQKMLSVRRRCWRRSPGLTRSQGCGITHSSRSSSCCR